MDEILERFQNTLSTERGDDSLQSLYKNWGRYGNQEQRRNDSLQHQKSNRRNNLDICRGIYSLIDAAEDADIFKNDSQSQYIPNVQASGFYKVNSKFVNVLMHSEWMVEKPSDFSTNWYVAPCPVGVRVLVVASHGTTRCFTKYGQLRLKFSSLLPGGNPQDRRSNFSVLDCFYIKERDLLYVLDVLSWNQHIMSDGEMEFRQYWLRTKLSELPGLSVVSKLNKFAFKMLPMTPCDPESFQIFMLTYPPPIEAKMDGLLFFHKHASYVAGVTPLVGWLYPFMVPEVIGSEISIHGIYAIEKPADYVDKATFIQKFDEKLMKKKLNCKFRPVRNEALRRNRSESSMEAEECPEDDMDALDTGISDNDTNTAGACCRSWRQTESKEEKDCTSANPTSFGRTVEPEESNETNLLDRLISLEAKTSHVTNTDTAK